MSCSPGNTHLSVVGGHIGTVQHPLPEQGHDAHVRVLEVLMEPRLPVNCRPAQELMHGRCHKVMPQT